MQRPLWLCSIMVTSAEVRLTLLGSDRKLYSTFSPPWIFQGGGACVRVTLQRCSPSDPRVSLQPTLGFRGFHWEHTYTDREHQHTLFIFILILIILILIIIPINSIIIINIICILMVFILITAILIIHLLFIVFIDSQNCPAQPPGIWGVGGGPLFKPIVTAIMTVSDVTVRPRQPHTRTPCLFTRQDKWRSPWLFMRACTSCVVQQVYVSSVPGSNLIMVQGSAVSTGGDFISNAACVFILTEPSDDANPEKSFCSIHSVVPRMGGNEWELIKRRWG